MKQQKYSGEMQKFIQFLEAEIFHEEIFAIKKFKRGGSSKNYYVQIKSGTEYLVKLSNGYDKTGMNRVAQVLSSVSSNPLVPTARLIKPNGNFYFEYQNKYGIILEYLNGESISSYEISIRHLQQVLHAYSFLLKTNWDTTHILPFCTPEQKLQTVFEQAAQIGFSKNKIKAFLQKKVLDSLSQIDKETLVPDATKVRVIHGDFHNNNILFKNQKLIALLDFEEARFGVITEDLMRYILCLIQRLPVFVFPRVYVKKWIKQANKRFDLTKEDWILGLNSFVLSRAVKLFPFHGKVRTGFIRYKALIQFLFLMREYKNLKKLIERVYFTPAALSDKEKP